MPQRIFAQAILTVAISFINTNSLINYVTFVTWAEKVVTMVALIYMRLAGISVRQGEMNRVTFCINAENEIIPRFIVFETELRRALGD